MCAHEPANPSLADPQWPADDEALNLDNWRHIAELSLRGKPLDSLTVTTIDGLTLPPLFNAEPAPPERPFPGFAPYTRGAHLAVAHSAGWEACQALPGPDLQAALAAAREGLSQGIEHFVLQPASSKTPPPPGQPPDPNPYWHSARELGDMLGQLRLASGHVHLSAEADFATAAQLVAARRPHNAHSAQGSSRLGLDPLAALAQNGILTMSVERSLMLIADIAAWCCDTSWHGAPIAVSSLPYHRGGATVVEEIGLSLATGVEYLRALDRAGLDITERPAPWVFLQAAGRDFFTEIARLRSLRMLWALIMERCGAAPQARRVLVHSISSPRMLSTRDPWVNLMRITVATAAAVLGGADIVSTLPFDHATRPSDRDSRRLAAMTQAILREESHLARVADAAGGSWYVEHLTEDLASQAWSVFQEIEAAGGMARALVDGTVQKRVAASRQRREEWISHRRLPITGVSSFPKLDEEPLNHSPTTAARTMEAEQPLDPVLREKLSELSRLVEHPTNGAVFQAAVDAAHAGAQRRELMDCLSNGSHPAGCAAVPRMRDAEGFERLRAISDAERATNGRRPQAFLARIGSQAEYTPRSEFVENFLAAAGIEATHGTPCMSVTEVIADYRGPGCPAVIICSSDAQYGQLAAPLATALKQAGTRTVILAGKPASREAEWRAAGIDQFVFAGCDVLTILGELMVQLGVHHD